MLLPNYDPRFPLEWSFQPKFVVGAFSALILIRLFHLLVENGRRLRLAPLLSA